MDDIDRELKQIQLQRERLALKRELERSEWKANTIGIAGRGISRAILAAYAVFEGMRRFVRRLWKLTLVVAVIGASVYGGLMWREGVLQARLDAERAELNKFVAQRCGNLDLHDYFVPGYEYKCREEANWAFLHHEKVASDIASVPSRTTTFEAPVVDPAPVAAVSRYVVQVGQFADPREAFASRLALEKVGIKPFSTTTSTSGGERTSVRVGPFASRDDADKWAEKIKSVGVPAVVLIL